MPRPLWTVVLLLTLPCTALISQSASAPLERLNTAVHLSSLSDVAVKPWHLRTDFDLLGPNGSVREHGSLEEWWAAPDRFRITVTSPSYTATETQDGAQAYRTAGQTRRPDLVDLLVSQMNDPLEKPFDPDKLTAIVQKKQFGNVSLDCIMPVGVKDRSTPYLGRDTTYCFDPGQPDLRIVIRYREQFIIRNRVSQFQNRDVALDLSVVDEGKPILKSHTTQLSTYTPDDRAFQPAEGEQSVPVLTHMSSAVMAGSLLTKVAPEYPLIARQNRISGVVLLRVLIGKDGHVEDLTTIRSPDKVLTTAAEKAVRQWVYKPCIVNDKPVTVETTVTVNFNLG